MVQGTPDRFGTRRPRWAELVLVGLLVYHTVIGCSSYGLLVFYPRLLTQVILVVLFVVWLVMLWVRRQPFPDSPAGLPLLALGVIIVASSALSREPMVSLQDVPLYLTYVLIYYLVIERVRAGWSPLVFAKGLMLTVVVVCLLGLVEYAAWYLGVPAFPTFLQGWWAIGGWEDPLPPYWYRLEYTLNNPNFVASLVACTLPLGAAAAVASRSRWTRLNALLWLATSGLVLLLTMSRGGWLAALCGLVAFGLLAGGQRPLGWLSWGWRKWRWVLASLSVVVLGVVIAVVCGLVPWLSRGVSDQLRLAVGMHALEVVGSHPLLGTGPREFGVHLLDHWDVRRYPLTSSFSIFKSAHSVPLQVAAELGIPGAMLAVLAAGLVLMGGGRGVVRLPRGQAIWMAGFLAGLFAFAVHNQLDSLLAVPAVMAPVVILAGVSSAYGTPPPAVRLRQLGPALGLVIVVIIMVLNALSLFGVWNLAASQVEASQGRWEDAAAVLQRLPAGVLPASFRQFQLAVVYGNWAFKEQDEDAAARAIALLEEDLAGQPRYVPGRANLAALYWRSGDAAAAHRELTRVVAQMPEAPLYSLNLGLLHEQQGEDQAAIAWYAQALAVDPLVAASAYWQQTEWRLRHSVAIRDLAQRYIRQRHTASESALLVGQLAYHAGDLATAARWFRAELPDGGSNTDAWRWLVRTLVSQGRFREALEASANVFGPISLLQAQQQIGIVSWDYLYRARAHLALGHNPEAVRDFRTALFMGNREAYYDLGKLMLEMGNAQAGLRYFRQALGSPNGLTGINLNFDFLYYRQAGLAQSNLLPIGVVPPSERGVVIYLQLAELLLERGEKDEARQVCQSLLDQLPAYREAIECLRRLGD